MILYGGIPKGIQNLLNDPNLHVFANIWNEIKKIQLSSLSKYRRIIEFVYEKGVMAPCYSSLYAKLLCLMNDYYADCIRDLIYVRNVNGCYVCYDKNDETTPLCDGCKSKEDAFEITLDNVSVRQMICDKYQEELNEMKAEEEHYEVNGVMKENGGDITILDELLNRFCTTRHHLNSIVLLGELFNCGLLKAEGVMKTVFDYLITSPNNVDEEKTETLCKLLTVVGKTMYNDVKYSVLFKETMSRIEGLKNSPTLTSRVRFAIMDLIGNSKEMEKNRNGEEVIQMDIEDKSESEEMEERMKQRIEMVRKERLEVEVPKSNFLYGRTIN